MLPLQLSAGIHYSPRSSHRAVSAGPGARSPAEPPVPPPQPRGCAAAAARCRPPPRSNPAPLRPQPPGSAPEPRSPRYGNPTDRAGTGRGRCAPAGCGAGGAGGGGGGGRRSARRSGSACSGGRPAAGSARRGARPFRGPGRCGGSAAPRWRAQTPIRVAWPPRGGGQHPRLLCLPSFVWGAEGGVWVLVLLTLLIFPPPPPAHSFRFLAFSLIVPSLSGVGSRRGIPPGEVTRVLPAVTHATCVAFVWSWLGHMHLACSLLQDLLFACVVGCWNEKAFQRVPLELTFQACSGF